MEKSVISHHCGRLLHLTGKDSSVQSLLSLSAGVGGAKGGGHSTASPDRHFRLRSDNSAVIRTADEDLHRLEIKRVAAPLFWLITSLAEALIRLNEPQRSRADIALCFSLRDGPDRLGHRHSRNY